MKYLITLLCLSLASFANITTALEKNSTAVKELSYQIVAERSHKPSLFTQGLFLKDDHFYESSGLYAKSSIVSYPVEEPASAWAKLSAPFTHKQTIPDRYFAEGLTLHNNKIYVITWQEETLFVFDAEHFNLLKTLSYKGEGWGLTSDGKYLIRSDGSENLFFHDAENFAQQKILPVTINTQPIRNINELEYIEGFIWANIWHENRIIKIDPATGNVVGNLDLSPIIKQLNLKDSESVLNGIAYDASKKALWITGKQWPKMFLLKIQ